MDMKGLETTPFRESYMALAQDQQPRTVERIREELGLPPTSNVSESLRTLQAVLACGREWRLRVRFEGRSHKARWQLVRWVRVKVE